MRLSFVAFALALVALVATGCHRHHGYHYGHPHHGYHAPLPPAHVQFEYHHGHH